MSEYNNDSNDDLPYGDDGSEAASAEQGQYVENQYAEQAYDENGYAIQAQPEETYVESAYTEQSYTEQTHSEQTYSEQEYTEQPSGEQTYSEEYAEPQTNDYYTSDFQGQAGAESQEAAATTEYAEPNIFANQSEENYTDNADLYTTNETTTYNEYTEPVAYKQQEEYVEYSEAGDRAEQTEYATTDGYVAANEYLEAPAPHNDQNTGEYASEYVSEYASDYETAYVAPQSPEPNYVEENYTTENYTDQAYANPDYQNQEYAAQNPSEPAYAETGYDERAAAGGLGYEQAGNATQYADEATQYAGGTAQYADQYTDGAGTYNDAPDVNANNSGFIAAAPAAHIRTDGLQQDFRQEYEVDSSPKRAFPTGWMVTGISLLLLIGVGFYYLYDQFVDIGGTGNIPTVFANKNPIKSFPNGETTLIANGAKNTDRLPNVTVNTGIGTSTVTNVTPSLLDSREEVVDQSPKSEDRVETSSNVVADNDDKDIQNVLSLIKSSANNVEILLKSDDVSQLDQNQISIDGLETVLVNAKPVKLSDLIKQTNQQPETSIEQVAVANVDDLPVVSEGAQSPFKDVVANSGTQVATNTVSELPEATEPIAALPEATATNDANAQPLPETDLSKAISIATGQEVEPITAAPVNMVTDAPKPISRPAVPQTVPNTVSPQVASTAGGAYGVQLASLPSEASARQAFSTISRKFPNILSGYSVIIREAIIPGKGTFYRVFAGPIRSYNDANQVCATLRAAGGDCLAKKM